MEYYGFCYRCGHEHRRVGGPAHAYVEVCPPAFQLEPEMDLVTAFEMTARGTMARPA